MDLESILSRFAGENFVLYGGDATLLASVATKVNVIAWFTTRANAESTPPQQEYAKLLDEIYDANYLLVGTGNVGRTKAETAARLLLRAPSSVDMTKTFARTLIFHGYPTFVDIGISATVERYPSGSIVVPEDDKAETLQMLGHILDKDISVPLPLRDIQAIPGVDEVMPYIHVYSRIQEAKERIGKPRLPLTEDMPVSIMNIQTAPKMQYEQGTYTSAINWGQRKLLLSEIELLVDVISRDIARGGDGMRFKIIYVGAAPGSHIPYLLGLFSRYQLSADLWDRPSRFDIPESANLRITPEAYRDPAMTGEFEGFFTDIVASKYQAEFGTSNRLIFISDIRDASNEEAVMRDMEMQQGWVLALNPYASQLKFRLPFLGSDTYSYLDGDIYTQTWARNKSSESRLLSYRPFTRKNYNVRAYDESFAYFNMVTRVSSYDIGRIINTISGRTTDIQRYLPVPDVGFCTCHDCAREAEILAKYLRLLGVPPTERTLQTFIRRNTEASRPYSQQKTNPRTLWTRVAVKVPPYDRKILILFRTLPENRNVYESELSSLWLNTLSSRNIQNRNKSLLISNQSIRDITPASYSDILMYADGMSQEEIVDLVLSKKMGTPLISASSDNTRELFSSVLRGERFVTVFNFHTDFVREYNPARDLGSVGTAQRNILLQNMELARQNKMSMDEWGSVLMFLLSSMSR